MPSEQKVYLCEVLKQVACCARQWKEEQARRVKAAPRLQSNGKSSVDGGGGLAESVSSKDGGDVATKTESSPHAGSNCPYN